MKKRVWVLGAGFSAPLGGGPAPPAEACSPRASERDILVRYSEANFPKLHGHDAGLVRRLYAYGLTDGHLLGADADQARRVDVDERRGLHRLR